MTIHLSHAISRGFFAITIITLKSVGFLVAMTLNISPAPQAGNLPFYAMSFNAAQACPDDVSDCMVIIPDENDSIDYGSGGIVFDGGSSAGGGTVGSGGGGAGNGGSSGSSGSDNSGSIDEIEQCKLNAFEIKSECRIQAENIFLGAHAACFIAIFPPAIAGCELLILREKNQYLASCDFAYEINVANCD